MRLNQLATQINAKTIQLIDIAKALNMPVPNGGTPINETQQTQLTAVFRFMAARHIKTPKAAIAQMETEGRSLDTPDLESEEIAIHIPVAVADELCRRYPTGRMGDRILQALGALNALEKLCASSPR